MACERREPTFLVSQRQLSDELVMGESLCLLSNRGFRTTFEKSNALMALVSRRH